MDYIKIAPKKCKNDSTSFFPNNKKIPSKKYKMDIFRKK
jgi:hypothetical protein